MLSADINIFLVPTRPGECLASADIGNTEQANRDGLSDVRRGWEMPDDHARNDLEAQL
jgi:hypothetical protein